ncbi:HAD family hydrolase [Sphingobacterium paludis]|uniref:Putative hydrolase of the HAD superfamily n=1 Tax=Sphingobacterium paludis TaxID=1476465 RepID=A0A4R7DBV2_9SPHI|nr:HAD family phosphatase [Sphingobacterium paludis]TDS17761.1 putative hydrolase of the HAD superfamily [Sphingobacterium paludis]
MQKIKNIILDYGNVIFMIDFARVRQAFISLGIKNVDEFFGHRAQDSLFDAFDRGEISAAAFRDGIRQRSGQPELSDNDIDNAWNALLIGVPPGKHDVLEYLHSKYRCFLLSNNNEIHYARCMEHLSEVYGIADNSSFFEQTFYSHLLALRKPDAAIFEEVVRQTGIVPSETLFIDDSPQHLESAERLGFQTAHCTPEEPLEYLVEKFKL